MSISIYFYATGSLVRANDLRMTILVDHRSSQRYYHLHKHEISSKPCYIFFFLPLSDEMPSLQSSLHLAYEVMLTSYFMFFSTVGKIGRLQLSPRLPPHVPCRLHFPQKLLFPPSKIIPYQGSSPSKKAGGWGTRAAEGHSIRC